MKDSAGTLVSVSLIPNAYDLSVLIVLILVIFVIVLVAIWNIRIYKSQFTQTSSELDVQTELPGDREPVNAEHSRIQRGEAASLSNFLDLQHSLPDLIVITIMVTVLCCLVVFNLYFYTTAVWLISVFFATFSCVTLFSHGCKLINMIGFVQSWRVPANNLPILRDQPNLLKVVYFAICVLVSSIWLGCRQLSWAWVFQDILGISLITFIAKNNIFNAYKHVILVYVLFMLYDVIMIYVLPRSNSLSSMMTSVAFGFKTSYDSLYDDDSLSNIDFADQAFDDFMPLYLVIPNLTDRKQLCNYFYSSPYTFFGIGEVLLTSLSINYSLRYDMNNILRIPLFFLANMAGLIISMFILCLVASFEAVPQAPALIICPTLIIASLSSAAFYKETVAFLMGDVLKVRSTDLLEQFKMEF